MLNIIQSVVWGMVISLIGLASAVGINTVAGTSHSFLSLSLERVYTSEPGDVSAWVSSETR